MVFYKKTSLGDLHPQKTTIFTGADDEQACPFQRNGLCI
jgi:hypothetical protein